MRKTGSLLFLVFLLLTGLLCAQKNKLHQLKKDGGSKKEALLSLARLNRAMIAVSQEMRQSVIRLETRFPVREKPNGENLYRLSHATATMIHPGILVTVRSVVEGAESITGFPVRKISSNPIRLRVIGFHEDIALLGNYFEQQLPPGLIPVPLGVPEELPNGSLVFLVGSGQFSSFNIPLPGALFRLPVFFIGEDGKVKSGRQVLGLKGVKVALQDRGGLVCDAKMQMVGIAMGKPGTQISIRKLKPGVATQKGKKGKIKAKQKVGKARSIQTFLARQNFNTLIPAQKIMAAVNLILSGEKAIKLGPERLELGITCLTHNSQIRVGRVYFGSPAFKAGIKRGDQFTHWNNDSVISMDALKKMIKADVAPRKAIKVGMIRAGKKMELNMVFPGEVGKKENER